MVAAVLTVNVVGVIVTVPVVTLIEPATVTVPDTAAVTDTPGTCQTTMPTSAAPGVAVVPAMGSVDPIWPATSLTCW